MVDLRVISEDIFRMLVGCSRHNIGSERKAKKNYEDIS
jgi:hypothetical protein